MTDNTASSIKFTSADIFQKVVDSLGDSINKFFITDYYHLTNINDNGEENVDSGSIKYGKIQKAERRKEYYCFFGEKGAGNVSITGKSSFFIFNLGGALKIRIYQEPVSSYMIVGTSWHDITIHDSKDVIDNLWEKIKEIV